MCLFHSNRKQAVCVCVCVCVCSCVCDEWWCLATQTLIKVTLALIFEKQNLTNVEKKWGCKRSNRDNQADGEIWLSN